MSTDFFDDDLVAGSGAGRPDSQAAATERDAAGGGQDLAPLVRHVSDLDLNKLARQKRELDGKVAGAVHEIEQLQRRQHELESQKSRFENLARKQTEYEQDKRDTIERLDKGLISFEKEEERATRAAGLLAALRGGFKEALDELRTIHESSWDQNDFEAELGRAIGRVEEAKSLYKRGMVRVEASDWWKGTRAVPLPAAPGEGPLAPSLTRGFGYWLMVGFAFSLPVVVAGVVLFVVHLVVSGLAF